MNKTGIMREALDRRYSDLISSYLGDSEKAIARAFEEAADRRAFLILDEADSLLRDRAAARAEAFRECDPGRLARWFEEEAAAKLEGKGGFGF
jgi:hypothetical protein